MFIISKIKETVGFVATIAFLIFTVVYVGGKVLGFQSENQRLHTELIGKTESYEQLSTKVAKLENRYVEQKELKEKAIEEFGEHAAALEGRIKVLSNATFLIREKARKMGKSDVVYQGGRVKFMLNEIRFNDGPPIGYVLIFDDGRVVTKIYDHVFDVDTVISRDEDSGKYNILTKADFILKSPSINQNGEEVWTNRPFALNIVGGTAFIDPTEPSSARPRFHWWVPRINTSLSVGFKEFEPAGGLGISFMGYGPSVRDLDFKLAAIEVHYSSDKRFRLGFTPVLWRPFRDFLPNTYVGAGVTLTDRGTDFNFSVGTGF